MASSRAEAGRDRPSPFVRLLAGGLTRSSAWLRAQLTDRLTSEDRRRSVWRAVDLQRRVDRATRYQVPLLHTVHLRGVVEMYEQGHFEDARMAAEDVIEDCTALGEPRSAAALRAHGERARALRRLERRDEALDEFEFVLGASRSSSSDLGANWLLGYRLDLALTRRELGDLDRSTEELRSLVPDVVSAFGQDSAWMVASVTQLATNLSIAGDLSTAIEMVAALLPASTRLRGPMSAEALTLRSKVARWTIGSDASDKGRHAAARALIDFTRAGLSTCAEACELRYDYAESLFSNGEVDYAIAQLVSLREDLATTRWAASPFAESVRADLEVWRDAHPGGGTPPG